MNIDFLKPVNDEVLQELQDAHPSCLGKKLSIHSAENGIPELEGVKIAIFGVCENRREVNPLVTSFDFDKIRLGFYQLFPGNWHVKIADLGDILPGGTVDDTYYAVRELTSQLLKEDIIPVILGGSQDLTYAQYRAYDHSGKMVNLVNIDSGFDVGNADAEISGNSYIGKMVVEKPYNLFNYVNLGYQTYFNPPEEIELIEKLFFEAYRLGEVSADISISEPIMRDADLVSLDLKAVASSVSEMLKNQPNGFDGKEVCALARYAGISDKVSSFGFYNLQNLDLRENNLFLPAEILWYFVEGVNFRKNENNISEGNSFLKYQVPIDNEVLKFYKSKLSERWWVEIPTFVNNKLKEPTFLSCSYHDYVEACNQEIPERWYKARRKNEL